MTTPSATPDPRAPRPRAPVDRDAGLPAAQAAGAPVWSDALGRTGARSAQVLLIAAVAGWEDLQRFVASGPLPLAVIAFIGGFLPIVGALAVGILAALVALVTNGLLVALIVIAIVVAVSQLEGDVLQPLVMGRALGLHALVVLLALTVGTLVGGLFGAILAVPLTAVAWSVLQVWSDRYQSGEDPVRGADPLEPTARTRPTLAERWTSRRRRRLRHP